MTTPQPGWNRSRSLLVGALMLALFSVIAWAFGASGAEAAPPSGAAPLRELSYRVGDQGAYRLVVASDITMDPDGNQQRDRYDLRALLCTHVKSVDGQHAQVAMQLSSVERQHHGTSEPLRNAALEVPFAVRFDRGMPVQFQFPVGLDQEVQSELRELVHTFQATAPQDAEPEWTSVEDHDTGRYRAAYGREASGAWMRRKTAYLHGAALGESTVGGGFTDVKIIASKTSMLPALETSWWESATARDELLVSVAGQNFAKVLTSTTLTQVVDGFDPNANIAGDMRVEEMLRVPVPILNRTEPKIVPKPATEQDRARMLGVIAKFVEGNGKDPLLMREVAAMLRQFPELAAEFPPMFTTPGMRSPISAGLLFALESAGNESCQDALLEVCLADTNELGHRSRAIAALGGVANPQPETVAAAWQLTQSRGTDERDHLAKTALLAIGNLGKQLRAIAPDRYAELVEGLRKAMGNSNEEGRAVALRAIANTRDPELLPFVTPELAAADIGVRTGAIAAVAAINQPESLLALTQRLPSESNGRVRGALVRGLQSLSYHDKTTFAVCANMLTDEADDAAREAMARYLADNLAQYPAGRTVLELLVKKEQVSGIRTYVAGKLLRARTTSRNAPGGARRRRR